jgi:ABC-type lipoprotein export system ATPase subunit
MPNSPAGSMWSKWDLHVHTPYSIVHNYPGEFESAWAAFVDELENLPPEFKVIGVNDYLFIEGYTRLRKEKLEHGRLKNIDLLLPVVEFRLDKFAGVVKREKDGTYSQSGWNRINLHVIFDALDPLLIHQQFLGSLAPCYDLIPDATAHRGKWNNVVTRDSLIELGKMIIEAAPAEMRGDYASPLIEGFNNLCVSLEKIREALKRHSLENKFLIAVGKTEWENLKWDDQSIAEKRNIINQADVVFTASQNPKSYDEARAKLKTAQVNDKLLDCSDAHAPKDSENKDRVGNCFTWIKADTTFEGLRQSVREFDDRVFVGDIPPKLALVELNRTKYATNIRIALKAEFSAQDAWFSVDLPLNSDLVAIIGNKGSGKSAMADIAALSGDTKNFKSFSFLNDKRFRNPKNRLAQHFISALRWQDGNESERNLDADPAPTSVERIKYLPQSYLETLCNELGDGGSATFDTELRKIIYTHVPLDEQLGYLSMDELLGFKVAEIDGARDLISKGISEATAAILQAERRLSTEFKKGIEDQLLVKRGELDALRAAAPSPVEDPNESEAAQAESRAASDRIQALEVQLEAIRAEESALRGRKIAAVRRQALLTRVTQAIENFKSSHAKFLVDLQSTLDEIDQSILAKDLVKVQTDTITLNAAVAATRAENASVEDALASQVEGSLSQRRGVAQAEVDQIKGGLGERERRHVVYKEELSRWTRAQEAIVGSPEKLNSIRWLEAELESIASLPEQLVALRAKRDGLVRDSHALLLRMVEEYRRLYEPVQSFVKSAAEMDMELPLDFDVRIEEADFHEEFLSKINRQARGSFSGVEESAELMRSLIQEADFSNAQGAVDFLTKIDDMLHFDRRENGAGRETRVVDQLRKGVEAQDVFDYLYGMSYLAPRYSLTYDDQEIGQLSPGERGLLLLVFYLLVDKDDIPIVIDQPEENLDNQTIYKVLVKCIKAAKRRRQVIMVTHNPNLAVVCDAEQIIYAACDKIGRSFSYVSGAIESPAIKARVIEILEGTEPAFKNRKLKYAL